MSRQPKWETANKGEDPFPEVFNRKPRGPMWAKPVPPAWTKGTNLLPKRPPGVK